MMKNILKRSLSFLLVCLMVVSLLPTTVFAAHDSQGHPTDLNDNVYVAVYDGTGFPGEPAWYPTDNYTFINSNYGSGMSTYASSASSVLKREILDMLTQGVTTDGVRVWGYYNAAGTKSLFLDSCGLLSRANEEKIIKAVLGNNANVANYEIIWYVIKYQTDTYWHIDGLVVRRNTYNVNYYGNGNTSGRAPTGATGLTEGTKYTVLDYDDQGNNYRLRKVTGRYEWTFTGWNTQPDGRGTHYDADDVINITGNVSLYAQWQPPMTTISVSKTWNDANNQDGIRPDSISVHLLSNGVPTGSPVTLNADNGWTASWTVPAVNQDGNLIDYNIEETVPTGYTAVITGNTTDGFHITNTHISEKASVQIQKVWNDDHDRDGVRPASVQVQLYMTVDGVKTKVGDPVTVTNGTSWTHQWHDLEKYAGGKAIVYTVEEVSTDANYTHDPATDIVVDPTTGLIEVINAHELETTSIDVTKVWADDNNRDGIRPASVTVTLFANGVSTGRTLTLSAESGWKGTFQDVYVNASGRPISYSVEETAPAGYTVAVTGSAAGGFTVTNTHTSEIISVPMNKVWDDNENQDGLRPYAVVVNLKDGNEIVGTRTLTADTNWTASVSTLKNRDGQAIEYTVEEVGYYLTSADLKNNNMTAGVPTGYTATASGTTVTNTHTPETANLNVQKVWNDADNNDGNRPHAVIITLHANGQPTQYSLTLDGTVDEQETEAWKGTWNNMPRYHSGQRISYTIVETGYITVDAAGNQTVHQGIAHGYSVTHSYDTTDTRNPVATATNSYTPQTTALNVQKVWDDDNNRDGVRPESVTVTLYADGQPVQKKDADGDPMVDANGDPVYETVTLNRANEWDADFTDLPKFSAGHEIVYTVVESAAANYNDPVYDYNYTTGVVTITNTHETEATQVTVTKTWDDNNDQDRVRPDSVTVTLHRNGDATNQTATLNADNDWTYTFTGLDKNYRSNNITYPVTYTVVETDVPYYTNEYRNVVNADGSTSITVTNIHTPETISIPVTKVWDDANDQDDIRADGIVISLYADGEPVMIPGADGSIIPYTITLTAGNNWQGAFEDLAKYDAGVEIRYTVAETAHVDSRTVTDGAPEGYGEPSLAGNMTSGFIFTNTHEIYKTQFTVTKVWDENPDSNQPIGAIVTLYKDGVAVSEYTDADGNVVSGTVILSNENNNTYTWTGLDVNAEGDPVNYTVLEVGYIDQNSLEHAGLPDGYSVNYSYGSDANGKTATVTNSYEPQKTFLNVTKIWHDTNNQDNVRPDGVIVTLYADGSAVQAVDANGDPMVDGDGDPVPYTVTLNPANHWDATFVNLQMNQLTDSGESAAIIYTVQETGYIIGNTTYPAADDPDTDAVELNSDYTITYNPNSSLRTVEIVNTHDVQKTQVTVTKTWDDNDDQDGLRPDSVTVTLHRNGAATNQTAVLSEDNSWTHTFTDLDVHHGIGVDNIYSVVETSVPNGYRVAVTGDAATGFTVTNTHVPEKTSVTVSKEWDDAGNQDGLRPIEITVILYKGKTEVARQTLTASGNWRYTFTGLDKYENGQEIVYTVDEVKIDGYEGKIDGLTITNTHEVETANLNVQKVWNDSSNNDGKRPYAVVITLYANGQPTSNTLTLHADNSWKGVWENMPRYHNGQRISYTVVETGYFVTEADYTTYLDGDTAKLTAGVPEGYSVTHSYNTADTKNPVATVTNSYTPETTSLNVQKIWQDADNQDGIRPDSVIVELIQNVGDGNWTGTGQTASLSPANEWDADFVDLPKYWQGQVISYSVREIDVPDGYTTSVSVDETYGVATVTNTHEPEKTKVTVTKHWDDNDDQDGIRPDSITVTLYRNGIATNQTAVLSEANDWTCTFANLDQNYRNNHTTYPVIYTVVESAVDGYTVGYERATEIEVTGEGDLQSSIEYTAITITNSHAPAVMDIPVFKIWDDAENQDDIRPDLITVTLYANGKATNMALTLDASNNWRGVFTDLAVNASGEVIEYTVAEASVEGYEGEITVSDNGTVTITNTHAPEKTTLTAIKVWDDHNDQDGKRPDSITVHLLADGVHMGEDYKVILSDANGWTYTWTGLAKYAGGMEIRYTVYEDPIVLKDAQPEADGESEEGIAPQASETYTASYFRHVNDPTKITITNTYTPETTTIAAIKIWDDGDNRDRLRPESITVTLHKNNVPVESYTDSQNNVIPGTITLNAENSWIGVWADLPKYENHGTEIIYTVVENDLPAGYTANIVREEAYAPGLFIITNVHDPETTGVTVTKTWVDEDNNDGKRPDGIIVQLYANGLPIEGATILLNEDNQWSHTWTKVRETPLYVFEDGVKINYTVAEVGYWLDGKAYTGLPDGYQDTYVSGSDGYTIDITNTRATEKTSLTVVKEWDDAENNDGIRPDSIQVTLHKNGVAVDSFINAEGKTVSGTVTLNETNKWTYTWDNLYQYVSGEEAVYTLVETAVDGYESTYSEKAAENGTVWTITNTHEAETKNVTVTKVWVDDNNAEKLRPNSVTAQLYKNGKPYGKIITLSAANGWKYTTELPVYEAGKEIEWTVKETAIPRYYSVSYVQNTLTIKNTIQSKDIPKTGDDANIGLWVTMLMVCSAGAAAILLCDRKRKYPTA